MTKTIRFRFKPDVLAEKAAAAGDTSNFLIAVRTGLRESTISRLLSGAITTPSLETACACADAYGTTVDDLVAGWNAAVPRQRTTGAAA